MKIVLCPRRVPQCNAYTERFVRSIKEGSLSRVVFLSEARLRCTLANFSGCYHRRRNHQGIENQLNEPLEFLPKVGRMRCQKRLGGMLNHYYREGA